MSTHGTTANGNGELTATHSPIEGIVAELEDLLAPLDAERQQLQARLNDIDVEAMRIREGIAALTGSTKTAPTKAKRAGRDSHDWMPSQKTLDDIYAFLVRSDEPQNMTAISEAVHTSRGTVKKALDELRRREQVRFAGQGGQGGANLYTVMDRG